MKKLIIIASVLLFAASCSLLECDQKDNLFSNEYHTFQIDFENDLNVDALLNIMINRYCIEEVKGDLPFLYFDIKKQKFVSKKSSKTLKIGIEPPLCFEAEYDLDQILEIVKEHNNYRVEGDIVEIQNLAMIVEKHYFNPNVEDNLASSELKGIWVILEKKEGINDAAKIIPQIVKGFHQAADKFANDRFNKPYCELCDKEAKIINNKFAFRFGFKYYEEKADVNLKNNMF